MKEPMKKSYEFGDVAPSLPLTEHVLIEQIIKRNYNSAYLKKLLTKAICLEKAMTSNK